MPDFRKEPVEISSQPEKKNNTLMFVLLAILSTAIIVGGGVWWLKEKEMGVAENSKQAQNLTRDKNIIEDKKIQEEEKKVEANKKELTNKTLNNPGYIFISNGFGYKNNAYYDYNIYKTDMRGENLIKITNYPAPEKNEIMNRLDDVQIIDNNYLGYYKCDTIKDNFNCSVFRVNLDNYQIEKVFTTDKDDLISNLNFLDSNTFIYSVNHFKKDNEGKIFLVRNNKEIFAKKVNFIEYFSLGDGQAAEAAISNLSFSPNGSKFIAYIAPGPGGRNGDTFIFNLEINELARISQGENAQWRDDNSIIFLRNGISKEENKLYLYNLDNKQETELISGNIQDPELLKDSQKIIYWVNNNGGQVWLYDIQKNQNQKILEDAFRPNWLSLNKIMVASGNPDEYSSDSKKMIVYDLSNQEKYEFFDANEVKGWIEVLSPIEGQGRSSFFYE